MSQDATGFVRKDMVKSAEPYQIGPGYQAEPAMNAATATEATARLVTQQGNTALVEVVCGCGAKIQLNCEYEGEKKPD